MSPLQPMEFKWPGQEPKDLEEHMPPLVGLCAVAVCVGVRICSEEADGKWLFVLRIWKF